MSIRQQIIAVSLEMFTLNGYERTSMAEIASRIGVSKPALYYHFANKESLFLAIVNLFMDGMEQRANQLLANKASFEAMLREMFQTLSAPMVGTGLSLDVENSQPSQFRTYMLIFEGIRLLPEARRRINRFYADIVSQVTIRVAQAQSNGEIRNDLDPQALAFQIAATFEGTLLMGIFNPDFDLQTISQQMFDNTWKTIAR